MSDESKLTICLEHGFTAWNRKCPYCSANYPVPPSSDAPACSHGCDKPVGTGRRSHDSAFAKERWLFWKAIFENAYITDDLDPWDSAGIADECLQEFDKRFGETAEPSGSSATAQVNEDT